MAEKRVLVVDDDADIRVNIKDILDDLGHHADTACDGPEALRLAGDQHYDMVLLDHQMPGMDGTTLHGELQKIQPTIVSVMITAHASSTGAKRALGLGVLRVLCKPVDLNELLHLVDES